MNGTKIVSGHQVVIMEVQDMAGKLLRNALVDKTRDCDAGYVIPK